MQNLPRLLEDIDAMDWNERLAAFHVLCSYIGEDYALRDLVQRRGGDSDAVEKVLPSFDAIVERARGEFASTRPTPARGSTGPHDAASVRMQVASWPGPHYRDNPFVQMFCDSLAAAGADVFDVRDPRDEPRPTVSILHVHWPEQVFWMADTPERSAVAAASTLRALAAWKADGARIVWMVHNLEPHDAPEWQRRIWSAFYRDALAGMADAFMTLSPSTVDVVREAIPGLRSKPATHVVQPTYPGVARSAEVRVAARAELGIPPAAKVVGCLGFIRRYKGIEELIEVFDGIRDEDVRLLIAGKPVPDELADTLSHKAAADARVRLVLSRIDDDAFCRYTAAADLIVIPFRNYLHSGSLQHALSAGRTVLTPAAPFSRDLRSQYGERRVRLYEPPLRSDELMRALADATAGEPPPALRDPALVGRETLDFYRQVGAS